MTKFEKGIIVKGTITGIESYGAFVSFDEFYSGLIHISEISHGYIKDIKDILNVGDIINVEILDVDVDSHHLKLTIKNIDYKTNRKSSKKQIIETKNGFNTLAKKLPLWIENKLKNVK